MKERDIIRLAKKAGMPPGWYSGPWFDDDGRTHKGVPACLKKFVALLLEPVDDDVDERVK